MRGTIRLALRICIAQYSSVMASGVVGLISVLIAFLSLQKYFVQGVATAGLKG